MILVDTSVWVDHFRQADPVLAGLLGDEQVLVHPFVIGELALGNLTNRDEILGGVQDLTQAVVAEHDEAMRLIERQSLAGTGIGYVDAHLLAAIRLTPSAKLWTRDRRLLAVAQRLGMAAPLLLH